MSNITQYVVEEFEQLVAQYAGSRFAVAVDSCTHALFLACKYLNVDEVFIPCKTYVSVPNEIIHAGGRVNFEPIAWGGAYQLKPYPIWDSAKRFTSGMYRPGTFWCVSFHHRKIVPAGRGGMILHDHPRADRWFRLARFSGRTEGVPAADDEYTGLGWHYTMDPMYALRGIQLMSGLPKVNPDQREEYQDLSVYPMFTKGNSNADSGTKP